MAKTAQKFIYEIAAEYSGESSIQRLQKDLKTLANAESFEKYRDSLRKMNGDIAAQRAEVERLKSVWKWAGGGPGKARDAYEQAEKALRKLVSEQRRQQQALRGSAAALHREGVAAREVANRYKELQAATRKAGQVAAARNVLGVPGHADIANQINQVKEAYRRLKAEGALTWKEQAQAALHMHTRIRALREQTNGWATQLTHLRTAWMNIAGVWSGARLFKASVQEFGAFQSAMLRVKAVSEASGAEMESLRKKAQELGAVTRYSAREVAEGMTQLAAAGQSAAQIEASIGAAMDIAAIAQMDVGTAADQLTNIMSQFGIEADKSARVADTLASGFTGAATTMDQLANALLYCGPVANALGYDLEDTTAILMALANAGYKGEKAGTALRGGFTRLLRPMKMGREVLEKYGISMLDAEGNIRNFAAVLDDIGKAGMTQAEVIKVFGQEAGPGMMALLNQGASAIRAYEERLRGAGGTARKTADEMESGIEGAFRRLQAAWEAFKIAFGDAALERPVKAVAEFLAQMTAAIAAMPEWGHQLMAGAGSLAMLAASASSAALAFKAFKLLAVSQISMLAPLWQGYRSLSAAMSAVAMQAGIAGAAMKGFVALAAAQGVINIVKLGDEIRKTIPAYLEMKAAKERLAESEKKLAERYAEISKATGVTIKTLQDLQQAEREGKIHFDENTKSWVAGAKQRQAATEQQAQATARANAEMAAAEGEALKEMAEAYKAYADEIKRIQDDIASRQKSLAAELREMGRSGMTDAEAWRDQKREAEEYAAAAKKAAEEARTLAEAGDMTAATERWKEAVQLADDARSAYRNLNKEVREGDETIISKAEALQTAMEGVREAGELATNILKEQQKAAHDAMRELEKDSGMAGLVAHLDDAQRKWLESWETMSGAAETAINDVKVAYEDDIEGKAEEFGINWGKRWDEFEAEGVAAAKAVGRALDRELRDRKTTVTVTQGRRLGGLIGAPPTGYARGGKLPGYGGGDRIPALLESGEFVIRKEAVRRFGVGVFDALNHLRLPEFPDLSALLPRMPQAAAATPGRTVNINLTLPSGDTYQLSADPATAARIEREQERWWALRSSNKVKKSGFARTR